MESNSQFPLRRAEPRLGISFPPIVPLPSGTAQAAGISSAAIDAQIVRLQQLADLGTASVAIAHEIKNAMVAVRTFVQVLLAENRNAELATVVQTELSRIDSLISQMLHCASKPKPHIGRVSLQEVLERTLRVVEPQLRERKIRLVRSYLASPDIVLADAHQLEQAFLNLLLNASDAIGENGDITVGTAARTLRKRILGSDHLEVMISDTGAGIPKHQLSRLFEPFCTTKENGTGLGLPITREIIERHQGTISVESQTGKGTSFSISLPRA
jgi:signal transduction histidine kinase